MAWRRPGDKPLSEPMVVRLLTHICVTRPQWVKPFAITGQSWVDTKRYPIHHNEGPLLEFKSCWGHSQSNCKERHRWWWHHCRSVCTGWQSELQEILISHRPDRFVPDHCVINRHWCDVLRKLWTCTLLVPAPTLGTELIATAHVCNICNKLGQRCVS